MTDIQSMYICGLALVLQNGKNVGHILVLLYSQLFLLFRNDKQDYVTWNSLQ